jgi:hypothetical protein
MKKHFNFLTMAAIAALLAVACRCERIGGGCGQGRVRQIIFVRTQTVRTPDGIVKDGVIRENRFSEDFQRADSTFECILKACARQFAERNKDNLQRWASLYASGALTAEDLNALLRSRETLSDMERLKANRPDSVYRDRREALRKAANGASRSALTEMMKIDGKSTEVDIQ